MNDPFPRIIPYGERAALIQWPPKIEPQLLNYILAVKEHLAGFYRSRGVEVELINAYHELLVHFRKIPDLQHEIKRLQKALSSPVRIAQSSSNLYHLPVCYGGNFGPDFEYLQEQKGMSREKIIHLHTASDYLLYFIGFLPGFLYLGGLDSQLQTERKQHPRDRIPKGAVGIAGKQTGIYPQTSPGGWQIIGNCPVPLFHVQQHPPSLFKPGDVIRFYAISEKEHEEITAMVAKGIYKLQNQ